MGHGPSTFLLNKKICSTKTKFFEKASRNAFNNKTNTLHIFLQVNFMGKNTCFCQGCTGISASRKIWPEFSIFPQSGSGRISNDIYRISPEFFRNTVNGSKRNVIKTCHICSFSPCLGKSLDLFSSKIFSASENSLSEKCWKLASKNAPTWLEHTPWKNSKLIFTMLLPIDRFLFENCCLKMLLLNVYKNVK